MKHILIICALAAPAAASLTWAGTPTPQSSATYTPRPHVHLFFPRNIINFNAWEA